MRTIKFRGKRITDNTWVYGCLVNNLWSYNEHHSFYGNPVCEIITGIYDGDSWEDVAQDEENSIVSVIPESVGEYIGLKDKNGKEVYEGDIIRRGKRNREVKWLNMRCQCGFNVGTGYKSINKKTDTNLEIIGNIFENHELINR